jgi:hypothetical protein
MWGGEKLVCGFCFFILFRTLFYHQSFAPIGLQKTNAASGWLVKKYLSVNYCDFLMPINAVTENPQKYLAAEKYY